MFKPEVIVTCVVHFFSDSSGRSRVRQVAARRCASFPFFVGSLVVFLCSAMSVTVSTCVHRSIQVSSREETITNGALRADGCKGNQMEYYHMRAGLVEHDKKNELYGPEECIAMCLSSISHTNGGNVLFYSNKLAFYLFTWYLFIFFALNVFMLIFRLRFSTPPPALIFLKGMTKNM